jgi:hypothetical protein
MENIARLGDETAAPQPQLMFSYIHSRVDNYPFALVGYALHTTSLILTCCCCECRRLQWKAVGDAGFAARVEHNIELAQHVE